MDTCVGVAVFFVSGSEGKKINPKQQIDITQIKVMLMMSVTILTRLFDPFDAPPLDEVEGVNDTPVPGIPTVGRMPRLPTFNVAPGLPSDALNPPLLRLIRNPFPKLNILRNRKGITAPNAPGRRDTSTSASRNI